MKLINFIFVFFILVIGNITTFGQNNEQTVDAVEYFDLNKRWYNEFTEHWFYFADIPENEVRNAIIQWEQIGKDLKTSSNKNKGTYGDGGDTHGSYFRWSEKSGFIWLNVNKCQGGPVQIVRGKVSADNVQIRLTAEFTLGNTDSHGHHDQTRLSELLFVKWKGASFLVPKESIENFADYTAGLGEYNQILLDGFPFLVKSDSQNDEKSQELPVFPKGFEKFLKKPVKAQIISIGKSFLRPDPDDEDWDNLIIPVKLNVGKNPEAKPDLKLLYINQEQHYNEKIIIKKVKEKFSTAEIIRPVRKQNCAITDYNDCVNPKYINLQVGLRLSSTGD